MSHACRCARTAGLVLAAFCRALAADGVKIAKAVGGADGGPTADAAAATARFIGTGDSTLAAWTMFRAEVLTRLDARLVTAGRPPLGLALAVSQDCAVWR
jgi:hypothetical protein